DGEGGPFERLVSVRRGVHHGPGARRGAQAEVRRGGQHRGWAHQGRGRGGDQQAAGADAGAAGGGREKGGRGGERGGGWGWGEGGGDLVSGEEGDEAGLWEEDAVLARKSASLAAMNP